jgi:autotransporter-associated beta strand protein
MEGGIWRICTDPTVSSAVVSLGINALSFKGNGTVQIGASAGSIPSGDIIQGTGRLVVAGDTGLEVQLSGLNRFSGGVTLAGGKLTLLRGSSGGSPNSPGSGPLGTGTMTITGGTFGIGPGVIGTLTIANRIQVAGDFSIELPAGNPLTISGTVSLQGGVQRRISVDGSLRLNSPIPGEASSGLIKAGPGQLILAVASLTNYTGVTTVLEGTLRLESQTTPNCTIRGPLIIGDGSPGSTAVVRIGGNSFGQQIADEANVTLNGGRLELDGYNETAGVLTLMADSTLDFGEGGLSIATFDAFENAGRHTLEIENWNGELTGGGIEQLRFENFDPALLDSFHFTGYPPGAVAIGAGFVEIVPVPEPTSSLSLAGGMLLIGEYRRRRAL